MFRFNTKYHSSALFSFHAVPVHLCVFVDGESNVAFFPLRYCRIIILEQRNSMSSTYQLINITPNITTPFTFIYRE